MIRFIDFGDQISCGDTGYPREFAFYNTVL